MTKAQKLLETLQHLPDDQQQQVLDFVEFLAQRHGGNGPRRSPFGLWADLGVDITADDIAEARAQMWGAFPREDVV